MNKKRSFTSEFKLEQVLKYLENHQSYIAVSNEAGIDHSVLRRWVSLYRSKGILGLEINKTKTTFSLDFKLKAVGDMIANNLSYFDASIKFEVPISSIFQWKKDFIKKAKDFPIHKPYHQLTKEQKNYLWKGDGKSTFPSLNNFFKLGNSDGLVCL